MTAQQQQQQAEALRDAFAAWLTNEESGLDVSIDLAQRAVDTLTALVARVATLDAAGRAVLAVCDDYDLRDPIHFVDDHQLADAVDQLRAVVGGVTTATTTQHAAWGDAVAAIRGCPGAPPAEAVEALIAAGDAATGRR